MPQIFISYRHTDSKPYVGRLYDKLITRFDEKEVFRDVDSIRAGEDFLQAIEKAEASCDALITVIGPQWLTCRDNEGRLRLSDPDDSVRREIETALAQDLQVVPVLVGGADMPRKDQLPGPLADLAVRKAIEISDDRFNHDVDRLVEAVGGAYGEVHVALGKPFANLIKARVMNPQEMFLVFVDRKGVGSFGTRQLLLDPREQEKSWNPIAARIREGIHTISVTASRGRVALGHSDEVSFRLKGGQAMGFTVERETSEIGHPQLVVRPQKPVVEP